MPASRGCQPVVTCPAVFVRASPFASNPPFDEHPLEGRIQRAFLDAKDVGGRLLNRFGDLEAVALVTAPKRRQDQHLECAWGNFVLEWSRTHNIDNLCH